MRAGRRGHFRRSYAFGAICIAFGMGAAIGAGMTEVTRAYNLAIPVTVLVSLLCDQNTTTAGK